MDTLVARFDENNSDGANLPRAAIFFDLPDRARAEALKSGLGAAVEAGTLNVVESLDALGHVAQSAPEAQLVIVFPRPDIEIGNALDSGVTPRKALAEGKKRTEALLETLRGNRRRVALIDDATLLADPKRAKQLLGTRIDLPTDETASGQTSLLLRLIGQAILAQDVAASTLAAELVASSRSGEGEALSLEAAQEEFATLRTAIEREKRLTLEVEQYKAQLGDRQEEQDSVLAELLSLQETLRSARDDVERKTAQVLQLGQGLESTEAQVRQLNDELKAQRTRHAEESRSQSKTLEEKLAALEERKNDLKKLEAAVAELRRQIAERDTRLSDQETLHAEALRQQAETLEESLIALNERRQAVQELELIAADLRQQISERDARLSEQETRHAEAIRQQARMIEEGLSTLNERALALEALEADAEKLRRAVQDKEGEVTLLTGRLAQSDRDLRERDANLQALDADLKAREADLNARDAEIAAFYRSRSYRMTAPFRWLRAALSGRP